MKAKQRNHDTSDQEMSYFNYDVFNDVASWPSPIPANVRIDLVRNGTRSLQHKQGPFDEVDGRFLSASWFQKAMPNGQKVECSWLNCSMKKILLSVFIVSRIKYALGIIICLNGFQHMANIEPTHSRS